MCQKLGIRIIAASSPQAKDYASHCTPLVQSGVTVPACDLRESLRPGAFRGSQPVSSYR